jgi:hypothetical protein
MDTRYKCSLRGAIDDARGNITSLYFCENECLNGYFEVKRQTLLEYGLFIWTGILYLRHPVIASLPLMMNWKVKL